MASKILEEGLKKHFQAEFNASRIYLSAYIWFKENNYNGFARWSKAQHEEEHGHGLKVLEYMLIRGMKPTILPQAENDPSTWKSCAEVFHTLLQLEKDVGVTVNALFAQARKEKDFSAENFWIWFIEEQVGEVDNMKSTYEQVKAIEEKAPTYLFSFNESWARAEK